MAHAGGRPTKYNETVLVTTSKYIQMTGREQTALPTIEGLSFILGVDDDQINEWSKKYPEFHAAIKELKAKQKDQLMNDGLYGGKEVNSTMAIFLLKVNHGMIETEKKIFQGDEDNPIHIDIGQMLNKIYGTDKSIGA